MASVVGVVPAAASVRTVVVLGTMRCRCVVPVLLHCCDVETNTAGGQ
jgi:hypothetical protein